MTGVIAIAGAAVVVFLTQLLGVSENASLVGAICCVALILGSAVDDLKGP